MKRVLSLVLALVLVFGTIMPAFAEDAATTAADSQAGQDLMSYGVIAGTDKGLEEASVLTREQMTVILSQLYGMKAEAEAYAFAPSFTDVEEGKWSTPYIAFAEQKGWMSGDAAGGTFRPTDVMKAQEVNAMFVKALGYTVEWADVNTKAEELEIAVTAADSTSVLRGEGFAALRTVLDTPKMDATVTLGTDLELTNYVSPTPAAPESVEITGAVSINSVLVEVSLDDDIDAPTAVTADQFTVVDEDDAAIEVASVEFAAWDVDNFTVLVKLADDTEAGSLYTITSGDASENFGGLDEDEDEVDSFDATSDEYNELTLVFSEGVDLDTLVVEVEENNSGDELAVLAMEYDGKDTVVLTTDEQSKILYKVTVTAIEDLAGNTLDDDIDNTFVGTEMDDSDQEVVNATGNYTDEVIVEFLVKVNEDDLDASNFTIVENNDKDEEVVVLEARLADEDDKNCTEEEEGYKVILVTENTEKVLYKLTVDNVGTKYGQDLDSDEAETTFVGVDLPEDDFAFESTPDGKPSAADNTTVTMTFPNKMDKATAEDLANYEIVVNSDNDKELVVTAAELDDNNVTVELTVEEMDKVLYMITVTGVEDIYGNTIDSDEEEQTFVGKKVADAIEDIEDITNTKDGTLLTVKFDQNLGDNAEDIANYFIDGGIGYPTKAEMGTTDDTIKLTIAETTQSKVYKLTVTNLENADGVAMDSDDEVKGTFVGTGAAADKAQVVAAEAVNVDTLKVYFDTDVDDIDNLLDGTMLEDGALTLDIGDEATRDIHTGTEYAVMDETDDKVLIIYDTALNLVKDGSDESYDLTVVTSIVDDVDAEENEASFAYDDSDPTDIDIEAVESLNNETIKIYFNQAVRSLDTDFAVVDTNGTTAGGTITFLSTEAANDGMTQWYVVLNGVMPGDDKYELVIDATPDTDISVTETVTDTVVAFEADTERVDFAGDDEVVDYIDNVTVMMTDEKTIEITFPEDMNTVQAETKGNYGFVDAAGHVIKMSDKTTDYATTDIGFIELDDNVVTIMLLDTFTADADSLYVSFDTDLVNKLGTKNVQDDEGDAIANEQMAIDDEAAAEVALDDLEASADSQTVVITLDQDVTVAAAYTTKANFLADFKVYVNGTALEAAAVSSVALATDEITVTLAAATIAVDDAVKVVALDTTNVTGSFNAEGLEEDSEMVVAVSGDDSVAPTIDVVTIASNNADTTLAKEGDDVVVSFTVSEAVDTPVATIAGHTATVVTAGGNDWTATVTMAAGDAETAVAFSVTAEDAEGNDVTATATTDPSTVTYDETAPTVTSNVLEAADGDDAKISLVEGTTVVITFSQTLDATSKTAVETAVAIAGTNAASVTEQWSVSDTTFTVELADDADGGTTLVAEITVAADVTATITDLAGNSSAAQVLITDN